MAALASLASIFLFVGAAVSTSFAIAEKDARVEAEKSEKQAISEKEEAEHQRLVAVSVTEFFINDICDLANMEKGGDSDITLIDALLKASSSVENRFDDNSMVRGQIHLRLGQTFVTLGHAKPAIDQLLAATEILGGGPERFQLEYGVALRDLGHAYYLNRDAEKGREQLLKAIEHLRKHFGEGHVETLKAAEKSLYLHRDTLWLEEFDSEAKEDHVDKAKRYWEIAQESLGAQDVTTLRLLSSYSWSLRWSGETELALEHARQASEGLTAILGHQDYFTLFAKYNLAQCLRRTGELKEAAQTFETVWRERSKTTSDAHSNVLWPQMMAIEVWIMLDDRAKAVTAVENMIPVLENSENDEIFRVRELVYLSQITVRLGLDNITDKTLDKIFALVEVNPSPLSRNDLERLKTAISDRYFDKDNSGHARSSWKELLSLPPNSVNHGLKDWVLRSSIDFRSKSAKDDFAKMIEAWPEFPRPYYLLAMILATHPDENVRDGNRAILMAQKACELENYENWRSVYWLAAAYAEVGDFDAALEWLAKSKELAPSPEAQCFSDRLEDYRENRSHVDQSLLPEQKDQTDSED